MGKPADELYGIHVKDIARICAVSLKTAMRWKAGTSCPPETAKMILRRDLGCFAKEWAGWTVNGEELVPPWGGWTVRRDDALAVPLMEGQISALRAKIADLEEAHEGLEEQPLPGEIPAIAG